jgi:tetratricopeptide (TPR) repeat protein
MDTFREAELLADDSRGPRLAQAGLHVRQGRFADADRILDPLLAAGGPPDRLVPVLMIRIDRLAAEGRQREVLDLLAAEESTLLSGLGPQGFWLRWAEKASAAHRTLGDIDAAFAALDRAGEALGEPLNRFLALQRMELLIGQGAPADALAEQLERLQFFETQFTYGAAVALIEWARANLQSYTGDTAAAVETMRAARDRSRRSGSSLDIDSMEAFDLELARLLRADGQLAEARGLLDGLLDQHPALAEARWERAGLEDQAGNRDEALADLDTLIEQWSAASPGHRTLVEVEALRATLLR